MRRDLLLTIIIFLGKSLTEYGRKTDRKEGEMEREIESER